MVSTFTVDEVFEMAEIMERNGADFYRKTADLTDDPKLKAFLLGLSNMEIKHEAMFKSWRKELADMDPLEKMFNQESEGALYLQTIVDGKVSFEHEEHGSGTMEEVLKGAIASEKDTVIFYLSIKEAIPEHFGKGKIDRLITEELGHVRSLTQLMTRQAFEKKH